MSVPEATPEVYYTIGSPTSFPTSPAGATAGSLPPSLSFPPNYNTHEESRQTKFRIGFASTLSMVSFNLIYFVPKDDPTYTLAVFILSNLGIVLGNAAAFPPSGDYLTKIGKVIICAGIGQLALLPYFYLDKEKYWAESAIGLAYTVSLATLWNLADSPKSEDCNTSVRRICGSFIAVGGHKVCEQMLPKPWALVVSNVLIALGNLLAFPPDLERSTNKSLIGLASMIIVVSPLATYALSESLPEQPYLMAIASTICGIIPLSVIWYKGRRNLVKTQFALNE